MIVITIAFVSGIPAAHMPESLNVEMCHACHAQVSFVSVVCRSSDLSIHVQTILLHKRIASAFSRSHDSSSNDRFSPHTGCVLHGKQYFRNTATFGILPSPLHSMIHRLQTERRDSFRVRDSHPIPLFSEQECVSKSVLPSGRACATKAIVCNFYQCAVVSCESSFAKLAFFGKRCIRSFHCFLRKQGQLH